MMKKITIIGILLVLFTACNSKSKEDHSEHKSKKITFYTCSMDPQVKVDKPGKCPICQMNLAPIKSDDTQANEISLSKQQIQLGNITTQTITATQSSLKQSYNGVLTINQEKINAISSRAMGRIEKLYFKTIGQYIAKNQPIYSLYSEDIVIAKQDYLSAYKQLTMPGDFGKNARTLLNAAKQKLQFYGLSNVQIENIKTNSEISAYTTFYSTSNGYIAEVMVAEGSYVMEGAGIIKLADLSNLWLETQVNVTSAKNITIGQNATISFPDFPNKTSNAKVAFINPEINPDTRLLLIRFDVPNLNLKLKPGMQAVAKLNQSNVKGIFIPTDAVIREEKASYIWIEKRAGLFENLMVETGMEINGMIEIKSEIDSSKKVVITGAYAINSEYKFRKGSDPMEGMKM
jgi:Cu(I)/Ag(I) efflux system membrane fusion protein